MQIQGLEFPSLGLGTFRLSGDETRDSVLHALSVGYRLIDTAAIYGNEEQVGEALKRTSVPRDEILVTTKLPQQFAPAEVLDDAATSLRKLGLDYVDLFLIHWPNPAYTVGELVPALDKIRQAGMARAVGVSNYTPSMVNEAVGLAPIAANEIEYHPYLSQDVLIDLAHKHDHAILAYCPLARGGVINDPVLTEIGAGYGKSASQVALRWLVQQERVVALPRSSKLERVEENAQIFDFELTDEEMAQVRALDREERLVNPKERVPDWERR